MSDLVKPIEVMTLDELTEYDASLRQRIVTLDIKARQDASRITELEEENKRLREALEPLSDELRRWDQHPDGWTIPGTCIMVTHLRRARKEIKKK